VSWGVVARWGGHRSVDTLQPGVQRRAEQVVTEERSHLDQPNAGDLATVSKFTRPTIRGADVLVECDDLVVVATRDLGRGRDRRIDLEIGLEARGVGAGVAPKLNPQVDLTGSAATAGIEQYRHAGRSDRTKAAEQQAQAMARLAHAVRHCPKVAAGGDGRLIEPAHTGLRRQAFLVALGGRGKGYRSWSGHAPFSLCGWVADPPP